MYVSKNRFNLTLGTKMTYSNSLFYPVNDYLQQNKTISCSSAKQSPFNTAGVITSKYV